MQIALIGCGTMGSALAQGLFKTTNKLFFYNRDFEKAKKLEDAGYGKASANIKDLILHSEVILLAVKPQALKEVASSIAKELKRDQLVVSVLSGTTIETLKHFFPHAKIIRMMPNLAVNHGEGVIGLCADEKTSPQEQEFLKQLFEPLGKIHWLMEDRINALTALTGSGPAFFFVMLEAMIDAGIVMGFSASEAQELIQQMIRGSLTLLEKTSKHPGELKWEIASPGGTTIAGLKRLEESALRSGIINTFLAAYERANQPPKLALK